MKKRYLTLLFFLVIVVLCYIDYTYGWIASLNPRPDFDNIVLAIIAYIVTVFGLEVIIAQFLSRIETGINLLQQEINRVFLDGSAKEDTKLQIEKVFVKPHTDSLTQLKSKNKGGLFYMLCMPLSIIAMIFSLLFRVNGSPIFAYLIILSFYIILCALLSQSIILIKAYHFNSRFEKGYLEHIVELRRLLSADRTDLINFFLEKRNQSLPLENVDLNLKAVVYEEITDFFKD
jgi:hypothetical protein